MTGLIGVWRLLLIGLSGDPLQEGHQFHRKQNRGVRLFGGIGAIGFLLGGLLLAHGLWRARAVPRWWPVIFMALTVVMFGGLTERVLDAVQAGQLALLLVIAAYTWRAANFAKPQPGQAATTEPTSTRPST
jgi:uncharacterized membrane protein YhhN